MSGMHDPGNDTEHRLRSAMTRLRAASLWADALSRYAQKAHALDTDLPLLCSHVFIEESRRILRLRGGCCVILHFPAADVRTLHVAGIVLFETLRRTDIMGRLGKRTLAVTLPDCPLESTPKVLTRIKKAFAAETMQNPQAKALAWSLHALIAPLHNAP